MQNDLYYQPLCTTFLMLVELNSWSLLIRKRNKVILNSDDKKCWRPSYGVVGNHSGTNIIHGARNFKDFFKWREEVLLKKQTWCLIRQRLVTITCLEGKTHTPVINLEDISDIRGCDAGASATKRSAAVWSHEAVIWATLPSGGRNSA